MGTRELELDSERLGRVTEVIEADVAAERYDGAVVLVAHRGQVALHEAVGFAEGDLRGWIWAELPPGEES